MFCLVLLPLALSPLLVAAQSPTSSASVMITTSASTTAMSSMSFSSSAATSSSSDTSPPFSITALPAVQSANACVFNCLIPIGLADPSGCDEVSNDCACLSAPPDVMDFLTSCIATVCKSSTSEFAASATSLYESYCQSLYPASVLSMATSMASVSDASAAAAGTTASTSSPSPSATASKASSSGRAGDPIAAAPMSALGFVLAVLAFFGL